MSLSLTILFQICHSPDGSVAEQRLSASVNTGPSQTRGTAAIQVRVTCAYLSARIPQIRGDTRADGAPLECVMEHKHRNDCTPFDGRCFRGVLGASFSNWMNLDRFCPLIDG